MHKRRLRPILCLLALLLGSFGLLQAQQTNTLQKHVAEVRIEGGIGPATTDYLIRSMQQAEEAGAQLVLIIMDTPGGLDAATRDIIAHILASPIPVVTYVHPAGSRAASAGTYILYGSHVAAMTPSTHLGAATPVAIGGVPSPPSGGDESDDADSSDPMPPGSAMERKVINDSAAYIRGLAERYGRNADWAEAAVRDAVSLTAREALELNVIDLIADNREDLLAQLHGREISLEAGPVVLDTQDLPIIEYAPDWRSELLAVITNPQIASILLLIGIYGLILEGYNPGAMVPGVVGVICLLLGLYALQVLPINYAGLALIVIGALMVVAEAFLPSFGILGLGGIVAVIMGSIMLVDTDIPGMEVSYEIIGAVAAFSSILMLGIMVMLARSLRMPRIETRHAMQDRQGKIAAVSDSDMRVLIDGELWSAHSESPLSLGQKVRVVHQDGLHLTVEPDDQG